MGIQNTKRQLYRQKKETPLTVGPFDTINAARTWANGSGLILALLPHTHRPPDYDGHRRRARSHGRNMARK